MASFQEDERKNDVNNLVENVSAYEVIEKYSDDPKWAVYLHLKNGNKLWSQTIKGSFMAKHPISDLTFVFSTKEEAIDYAKGMFINATLISHTGK
jgi:hypothetical protein